MTKLDYQTPPPRRPSGWPKALAIVVVGIGLIAGRATDSKPVLALCLIGVIGVVVYALKK